MLLVEQEMPHLLSQKEALDGGGRVVHSQDAVQFTGDKRVFGLFHRQFDPIQCVERLWTGSQSRNWFRTGC